MPLAPPVHVAAMADFDDQHDELPIPQIIDDPVRALTYAIALEARQLLAACRPRILRERADSLQR